MKRSRAQIASQPLFNGLLILAFALIAAPAVFADVLDSHKASGHVGEQLDGYVGIVTQSPSPELKESVDDVNDKRRERYAGIAKSRCSQR